MSFNETDHGYASPRLLTKSLGRSSRSLGRRSRSAGDDHTNVVNSVVPAPLKGFQPKLTQVLATVSPRTD